MLFEYVTKHKEKPVNITN